MELLVRDFIPTIFRTTPIVDVVEICSLISKTIMKNIMDPIHYLIYVAIEVHIKIKRILMVIVKNYYDGNQAELLVMYHSYWVQSHAIIKIIQVIYKVHHEIILVQGMAKIITKGSLLACIVKMPIKTIVEVDEQLEPFIIFASIVYIMLEMLMPSRIDAKLVEVQANFILVRVHLNNSDFHLYLAEEAD